jgi:hypothetical protein
VKSVATIVVQFFPFERTSRSSFDTKLFWGYSLSVRLNLALQIFKHEVLVLTIFFKIQECLDPIQKQCLVPCAH